MVDNKELATARDNSNIFSGMTSASELFVGALNANILQGNFESLQSTADEIELQAEQRTNILREKYNASVGDYKYTAVARGFDPESGSARQNVERSSMALGEDIQMTGDTAKRQADAKRREADAQRRAVPAQLLGGLSKSLEYLGGIK
jgi:hypothetical protein